MATKKMKRGKTAEFAIGDDDTILVRPLDAGPFVCLALHDDNLSNATVMNPKQARAIGQALIAAAKVIETAKPTPVLVLVDEKTGEPMVKGQSIETHDGDKGVLEDWREPRDPQSTLTHGARVYVKLEGRDYQNCYFPSVIGAKFVWR
jgi:hypothetical protein